MTAPAAAQARETGLTSHPKYIVVFKQRSEKNEAALKLCRKMKRAPGALSTASRVVFAKKADAESASRLYPKMGVAATDLSAEEYENLRSDASVAAIVENRVRSTPPVQFAAYIEDGDTGAPLASAGRQADPRLAYMDGMMAAIQTLRAFESGQPSVVAPTLPVMMAPPSALASPRLTWGLRAIGIRPGTAAATGSGIKVAVLDTGVNLNHPDLAGRVQSVNTESFIDGATVQDGNGHGSHCVGVLGGPVQSASGIRYGVAPNCELLVGKVLSNGGSGFDDGILEGIQWAADNGARVISMSLGAGREVNEAFSGLYESIAAQLLDENVLIVAAAGNESDRPFFTRPVGNPAACPSIAAVAAIDIQRRIADFSCRRMDAIGEVDLCAPGVAVFSAWKGTGFQTISGTSMATPHVAGVAALILERNPTLTARELWAALTNGCVPMGDADDFGKGLVQAP